MIYVKGWWRMSYRTHEDGCRRFPQKAYYRGWFLFGIIPLYIVRKWE